MHSVKVCVCVFKYNQDQLAHANLNPIYHICMYVFIDDTQHVQVNTCWHVPIDT